jgi:hypothetical protein
MLKNLPELIPIDSSINLLLISSKILLFTFIDEKGCGVHFWRQVGQLLSI